MPWPFSTQNACLHYFLAFPVPLNFNWLFLICRSLSISSVASSIAISYFGSAGSFTWVGFGWRSVSSVMFSRAWISSFTWIRHFSHRIGGSEVGRSQKGSIDNGVFRDSRADCAMSYRLRYCIQNEFCSTKFRDLLFRNNWLFRGGNSLLIIYSEDSLFWVLNLYVFGDPNLALLFKLVFRLAKLDFEWNCILKRFAVRISD